MERPKRTQKRKIGSQASIVGVCWKPRRSAPYALLEDQHQQAVGGADREQVHQDRLERHDDASGRRPAGAGSSGRARRRRRSACSGRRSSSKSRCRPVSPVTSTSRSAPGEGRRDEVVAQAVDRGERLGRGPSTSSGDADRSGEIVRLVRRRTGSAGPKTAVAAPATALQAVDPASLHRRASARRRSTSTGGEPAGREVSVQDS